MNTIMMKNTIIPICRTCKHIIMDIKQPNDFDFARCGLLGKQCIVSGNVNYPYASNARRDFTMCGQEGQYYEKSHVDTLKYKEFIKY